MSCNILQEQKRHKTETLLPKMQSVFTKHLSNSMYKYSHVFVITYIKIKNRNKMEIFSELVTY